MKIIDSIFNILSLILTLKIEKSDCLIVMNPIYASETVIFYSHKISHKSAKHHAFELIHWVWSYLKIVKAGVTLWSLAVGMDAVKPIYKNKYCECPPCVIIIVHHHDIRISGDSNQSYSFIQRSSSVKPNVQKAMKECVSFSNKLYRIILRTDK